MLRLRDPELPSRVEVYAKLEYFNPGGSVKDRPARRMIEDGEHSGELRPGRIILDSTSGNTGIAYAMIGAAKGYRVRLAMPANVSQERKAVLAAYGAEVIFTDPGELSDGAILEARRIYEENPDLYFKPDQYNNPSNWKAHRDTTAPEIWKQTQGRITHFVATIGTSGTVMGTGRGLKALNPDIEVIAVEPTAFHGIEGLKHMESSIVPEIYREDFLDHKITADTEVAYDTTLRLPREIGGTGWTILWSSLLGCHRGGQAVGRRGRRHHFLRRWRQVHEHPHVAHNLERNDLKAEVLVAENKKS